MFRGESMLMERISGISDRPGYSHSQPYSQPGQDRQLNTR